MNYSKLEWRKRFQKHYAELPVLGLAVDLSRIDVDDAFFAAMEPQIHQVFADMAELEKGSVANPDQYPMIRLYWLRDPALAPTPEIRKQTDPTLDKIMEYSAKVHVGKIRGGGGPFKNHILIGIRASIPSPRFVAYALIDPRTDKPKPFIFDNADPDSLDRALAAASLDLNRTLSITIPKSHPAKENLNGMLISKPSFDKTRFDPGQHSMAVNTQGSEPGEYATAPKWLPTSPIWDSVAGRTSEPSTVGLLLASLQRPDTDVLLSGAKAFNEFMANYNVTLNQTSQHSVGSHDSGNVTVSNIMIVRPHKDISEVFIRFIQKLLMESLGKLFNFNKHDVTQNNSILGNKGSTFQQSYLQSLICLMNSFYCPLLKL
jgi:glucose-6-phosphate isomerase